ncbi:hypothetical protein BX666DRAFT_1984298 [Dichotomocladium elegans]|nr:hypothetical protein BX666DRAFT_1984298 [Dichotomocladium elegans]
MFKSTLALIAALAASAVLACEPECRHNLAAAFATQYAPVIRLAADELQGALSSSFSNVTVPDTVSAVVPDGAIQRSFTSGLSKTLDLFVEQATGPNILEKGIYSVMFAEEHPFKGDCNHPARLKRKMPPKGESWTREECEKMDYICGNPPSICHFLPMVKDRIVRRIQEQLTEFATFDEGFLVKNVVHAVKQSTYNAMSQYGAGSMVDDPRVNSYIDELVSSALRALKFWAAVDVAELCSRPGQKDACNGWDEIIIPEILRWP